jgi:hypothetical protein
VPKSAQVCATAQKSAPHNEEAGISQYLAFPSRRRDIY